MHAITRTDASPRPGPLAQVELLVLFHPCLQGIGSRQLPTETCAAATKGWLTLDVYGRRAGSGLTGLPIMENLRLEADGQDLEALLPDGIVNEVADYVLGME